MRGVIIYYGYKGTNKSRAKANLFVFCRNGKADTTEKNAAVYTPACDAYYRTGMLLQPGIGGCDKKRDFPVMGKSLALSRADFI